MSTQEDIPVSVTASARLVGQVKWFNNKAGYGFITASDGEQSGKDIFIHYSTINVSNSQYKYLVQGEYVEFTLVRLEDNVHEFHATEVSGIKGGTLMCETRRINRPPLDSSVGAEESAPTTYRKYRTAKPESSRRSVAPVGEDGFKVVGRGRRQSAKTSAPAS
jgi:cold shock CspA family protein